MTETLYFTKATDPNYLQTLVAAHFLNSPLPTQQINKKYDPLTLLTPQGTLNQPNTILLYLTRDQLAGSNELDRLRVYEWFEFFNIELHPLLKQIHEQLHKEKPVNKDKFEYASKELVKLLDTVNTHLKTRTVLVGDALTAADISLATHLDTSFRLVINEQTRKKLPHLARWFTFIRLTAPFQKVLGPVEWCGKQGFEIAQTQPSVQPPAEIAPKIQVP